MAIEASFTVDQSDFPLSAVFEDIEGATIELDRVVPTTGAVVPYLWIHGGDPGDSPRTSPRTPASTTWRSSTTSRTTSSCASRGTLTRGVS